MSNDKEQPAEPVAWTTEIALECAPNTLAFEVCAGNLWGERGVPLFRQPDPRIAEYRALLDAVVAEVEGPGDYDISEELYARIKALKEG